MRRGRRGGGEWEKREYGDRGRSGEEKEDEERKVKLKTAMSQKRLKVPYQYDNLTLLPPNRLRCID